MVIKAWQHKKKAYWLVLNNTVHKEQEIGWGNRDSDHILN